MSTTKETLPNAAGLRVDTIGGAVPRFEDIPEGIEAHLWAFIDVQDSQRRKRPVVTVRSTNELLKALGFDTTIGGYIVTTPFAIAQGHPTFVALDRIREGIRSMSIGPFADSGTFVRKTGTLDPERGVTFWMKLTANKGYATLADVEAYVGEVSTGTNVGAFGPLRLRLPGHPINELEIRLLFDLAAQMTNDGERVMTADRFVAFIDGSLWQDYAKARVSKRLYEPRPLGAIVHEDAKKVATRLIALSGKSGTAIWPPNVTLNPEKSLAEQQREKTIVPTLVNAFVTALPFGLVSRGDHRTDAAAPAEPSPVARRAGVG
jgi:hypothetical protein